MKKLRATDRDRRRSAPAARRGLRPVVAAPAQRPELALPRRISGIVQCAFRGDQIAQQFDPAARADYTGRRGGRCPSWSPKRSPTTRPPSGATAASPPQTPTPAASFSNSTHAAAPSSSPSLTRTDSSSRDPHGTNNERAAPNRYEPSVRANVHQTLEVDDQASLIASLPQPAGNSTASTRAASLEDDAGARDPAPMVLASGDG